MFQDTIWGTQEIPEPLSTKPQTVQVLHGALGLKQVLGSLPQAGRVMLHTWPQTALRDLAQKGLLSLLLLPHPIPLLCNLGIFLQPLK